MKAIFPLVSVLVVGLTANAQNSAEAMLDYAGTTPSGGSPIYSAIYSSISGPVGWTFQPQVDINVTALGAFDYIVPGTGELNVGLWDSSGNLLASGTITSFSALVNQSLYESIAPVALTAGQMYYLAAYSPTGPLSSIVVTPDTEPNGFATMSSEIQLGVVAYGSNSGFAFPATTDGYPGCAIIAPNFQFEAVPEPSTCCLFSGGVVAVFLMRRWCIKSRAAVG